MPDINPWTRVTKKHPCPICGKPDWCTYRPGTRKVACMRVESKKPTKNGGFLHYTDDAVKRPEPTRIEKRRATHAVTGVDLETLLSSSCTRFSLEFPIDPMTELGVSRLSLLRLETGLIGKSISFPMRDGFSKLVGFRLRGPDGSKWTVKGTHNGLFIPTGLPPDGPGIAIPLLICEGPTDCAALLDLGYSAIGRPSCSGGADHLIQYLKGKWRDIVIVSDNDEPKQVGDRTFCPGIDGAMRLAEALRNYARSIRVIVPKKKDIREWVRQGATRMVVDALIRNVSYFKAK